MKDMALGCYTVEKYLDDLEGRICEDVEDQLLSQWKTFADGKFDGDIFTPARGIKTPAGIDWPDVSVNDALDDFELMALQQFRGCSCVIENNTDELMCVRANYGTSILPSVFGAELFMMAQETNTLPTSRPLAGGKDAIRALIDKGVPDISTGLGGKVLEMGQRFVEMASRYPKIGRFVHIYHPDLQSPMDVCEILWGSSLFLDIVDEPDLVKEFLSLITKTYAKLMNAWDKIVPSLDGYASHWSFLHKGHLLLRADSAMNFSPAMYEEFIEPYDQILLDKFGGGALHFCGRGDHYCHRFSKTQGLHAIQMSQPECNDVEVILQNTVELGFQLLGFSRDVAEQLLKQGRNLHGNVHCVK